MATYTVSSTRIGYSEGSTTNVSRGILELVFPLSASTYSYALAGGADPRSDLPLIDPAIPAYEVRLDGVEADADNVYFGFIRWDGNYTVLMILEEITGADTSVRHLVAVGGDPLPEIDTQFELGIFEASITDSGPVTSGYFAPDQQISILSAPGRSIDENDDIRGSNAAETFLTGLGADFVRAGGGDDVVDGGAGWDTLRGGDGADTLYGRQGNDRLYGGGTADLLIGNDGDDLIRGDGGWDIAYGGDGRDRMFGSFGSDELYGGNGDDVLYGQVGHDQIDGNDGDDLIYGGDGLDALRGGNGNDTLYGGDNADTMFGHGDDDALYGGAGFDLIYGGDGFDVLYGNADGDRLYGGGRRDVISGGGGSDQLFGGTGWDFLEGDAGSDVLFGHQGRDRLIGGAQGDVLSGGEDADTFVFADGFGLDRITDFTVFGTDEVIDLAAVSAITDFADLVNNHLGQDGSGNARIVADADNVITLEGVAAVELGSDDFVFA
jgi:Ca2+-binding RTX toxin-like protein